MFSILLRGVMFSKLCSPNKVMGGRCTHSVSALLLVVSAGDMERG